MWEKGWGESQEFCVTRTKVLSPDELCTAECVLSPPAQHQHCFLVLFLVFPGFCCCGVQCLSCIQLVWLSLHWPSQTMSCSPSSLTVFPPTTPLGSSPCCVYVSICFLHTHRSCPGFTRDHLRGHSSQAGVRAKVTKASGRFQENIPLWLLWNILSLSICLQQVQWPGGRHKGTQIPVGAGKVLEVSTWDGTVLCPLWNHLAQVTQNPVSPSPS